MAIYWAHSIAHCNFAAYFSFCATPRRFSIEYELPVTYAVHSMHRKYSIYILFFESPTI